MNANSCTPFPLLKQIVYFSGSMVFDMTERMLLSMYPPRFAAAAVRAGQQH